MASKTSPNTFTIAIIALIALVAVVAAVGVIISNPSGWEAPSSGGNVLGGARYASTSQPSGTLSADPNPCIADFGSSSCASLISWKTSNIREPKIQVRTQNYSGGELMFQCKNANTAGNKMTGKWIMLPGRFFRLYTANDCTREGAVKLLDEITVEAVEPTGTLSAAPNPCVLDPKTNTCASLISWESSYLPTRKVQIRTQNYSGGEIGFQCKDANTVGSRMTGKWIMSGGRFFKLYAADDCTREGTVQLLDEITVGTLEPGPTCDFTGEPMVDAGPDFLSVDIYELRATHKDGRVEKAAQYIEEAGIKVVKKPMLWKEVETSEGTWNFSDYDDYFQIFADRGIEPEIELYGPPVWASQCEPPVDCKTNSDMYPANDYEKWDEYINRSVLQYRDITTRWAIWAEPEANHRYVGTIDEYIEMLNRAYDIIHELDPEAKVLAPQMNVGRWVKEGDRWHNWIVQVAERGKFDVFSIHILLERNAQDMVNDFNFVRETLDEHGAADKPLTVSSANRYFDEFTDINDNMHCPYLTKIGDEYAPMPERVQAEDVEQMYICLANAGAESVSYYRISDGDVKSWIGRCLGENIPSWCPCGPDKACKCDNLFSKECADINIFYCPPDGVDYTGILGPWTSSDYPKKEAYYAVQEIGEYLN